MKATVYSTETTEVRNEAIEAARVALRENKAIVLPTDTVYGIAADAFSHAGVSTLLAAKGRSRTMPPPVLIFDEAVLPGLADEVSDDAIALARKFWPGALTLILYSQPSLSWDLGETQGTVALRVPNDPLTIQLLREIGPLAVSSANKTGQHAATTAEAASEQLGEDVEVIIDGGRRPIGAHEDALPAEALPSTIVDCTADRLVVVREGAISMEELRQVVPSIITKEELEAENRQSTAERAEERRVASSLVEEAESPTASAPVGLGDGPRASAPAAGSFNAHLVEGGQGTARVDQMRTKESIRQEIARREAAVKPLSQSDARKLLFDDADSHKSNE
ncbi:MULTISPECIES: L-threonylcarbamoyladenylate synthase [Rothia]|uniref:L-threonylcarbamoyladenylate synthase n=1 Tax=Rothia TaxID=32207 RepID=UPI00082AE8EF|nr:L-threonylcarbamoyladenylate synthase [Rothia sp. ND6WE1A]